MPKGKKTKKREPKRRQDVERQRDKGEDQNQSSVETTENLTYVLKNEEVQELCKILQKSDLADVPVLLGAVALGKFEIVKRLLREGHDIDCCGKDGSTPLIWAAKSKNVEMIDLLICRGANIALVDEKGNNAILIALQSPMWDQDTFLDFWNSIKDSEHFDPNHANKAGYTMIHYAVKNQWEVLLESLLEKGVDVNCTTNKGVTPLMMAGSRNHCNMVNALLRYNADIAIEDERGCTALCYAIAFIIQKRLDTSHSSLERIISAMNNNSSVITLEDYIKRRLQLLVKPPEMANNFSDVISTVILSVVEFFLRFIQAGVELLLEFRVFSKVTEATLQHMDDADYVHAIIGVTFELVRYCDCCFGGGENTVSETELMDAFFDSGTADACLSVLKIHATTKSLNWLLAAALMPLFVACPSPGKGQMWLQSHYKDVQPFFHQYLDMHTVTYNFNADEYHVQLVKRKIRIFHGLMTKLENGEQIVVKKKVLLKRGFGDSRGRRCHSSNNEAVKSKSQEESVLYKTPIGEKNIEDLTACLATCSKKMRRKVVKSLKMGNKLCGDDIAKFNSLLAGNSNTHTPINTTSVPDLKNTPSTSSDNYIRTDLSTSYKKSQKNADPNTWTSSEQWEAYRNKSENNNRNTDEKKASADGTENKSDYLKQCATTSSDTPNLLSEEHNETAETVDIFIPSGKREYQNLSDSDSNGECELESQNDLSNTSETKCSEISVQNEFSETKLPTHKFKSDDNIAICIKQSDKSTSPMYKAIVVQDSNNKQEEFNKKDKMDHEAINSECENNMKGKDNLSDDESLDFSTLETLYQEFISKYIELWKVQRENDYPGHRCDYNGNRYLCQNKDETLKTLKAILPNIEQEYLERLSSAWNSLIPYLQNAKNKQKFKSVAKRLKDRFLTLTSKAEKKLQNLRTYKATCLLQNKSCEPSDESNNISYGLESIFGRNNVHNKLNMEPEDNHLCDFSQVGSAHFLQSVANLIHDDDDDNDVIIESRKINESSCLYEECSFFSDCSILDSATVCQKYDISYASMSLGDCIVAHMNQKNKMHENTETKSEEDIKEHQESSKDNISEYYDETNSFEENLQFHQTQTFDLKNLDQEKGRSGVFHIISSPAIDPQCFYSKNIKEKQISLEDFVNEQTSCNSMTELKNPTYPFRNNNIQEGNVINNTHSIKSSSENFSQTDTGFGSLCKLEKNQQTNDSEPSEPFQLCIPIPPAETVTVPAIDRLAQTITFSSDFNSISRWTSLILSFQSLPKYDCRKVDNGKLILSSEIKRSFYKISVGVNFGDVELGMSSEGNPLAVKRSYQYASVCGPSLSMLLQTTVTPLIGIRDEHILEYVHCVLEKKEIYLSTPLCEYNLGEYLVYLKLYNRLQSQATSLVRQFLKGLQFLHTYKDKPIVHGNLKPSNVLIDQKGVLKLSEFGLTEALYKYTCPPISAQLWWARETHAVYEQKWSMYCTLKSDIQVAGMLVHFILTGGIHPYGVYTKEIIQNMAKGNPSLKTTSCEINDLITWMLLYEPQQRPTIDAVLKHVYFWDMNKKWEFLLACMGFSPDYKNLPICLPEFHSYLDDRESAYQVKGEWVHIVNSTFPYKTPIDSRYSNNATGLLRFIRACVEEQYNDCSSKIPPLYQYFLSSFPALPLCLYRFIEDTEWIHHPALMHITISTENKHSSPQ